MKKENLIERAEELNISVPEGATNDQIKDLIKIAEYPILKEELEKKSSDLAALETEKNEATNKVADLTHKLSESESEKDLLQKKVDANTELKVELKAKGGDSKLPTYNHDGDTYQFTVNKILAEGKKITAEKAVDNKDLMEKLIKSNFFGLKKL